MSPLFRKFVERNSKIFENKESGKEEVLEKISFNGEIDGSKITSSQKVAKDRYYMDLLFLSLIVHATKHPLILLLISQSIP